MPSLKLSHDVNFDPFQQAVIFLSHDWGDNDVSDVLYNELRQSFKVLYDRRTSKNVNDPVLMNIGDHKLKREAIVASDMFLFVASNASMNKSSWAFTELQVADGSHLAQSNRIVMIALDEYHIPEIYGNCIYGHCKRATIMADAVTIAESIRIKLAALGGLGKTPYGVVAGREPSILIERLLDLPTEKRSLYPLAAVFTAPMAQRLIREVQKLPIVDQERLCQALMDIYLWNDHQITRQNAIYLLSRVRNDSPELIVEAGSRYPILDESFLYRGFHVALGFFGNLDATNKYAEQLLTNRSVQWRTQRDLNTQFHLLYYGGKEGTLAILRTEIDTLSPTALLALAVATLGLISNFQSDVERLSLKQIPMEKKGVSPYVIKKTIRMIELRARR